MGSEALIVILYKRNPYFVTEDVVAQWSEHLLPTANGSSSIVGKGKNQNIARSPVIPAVKWVRGPFGAGKVKAVRHDAGHITFLCAEAAES